MSARTPPDFRARSVGRRAEDRAVRDQNHRHRMLFHVGQIITSEMNLDALFDVIMEETNKIMAVERSTVFLHDQKSAELWSLVATGMGKNQIRMPDTYGVAGWCFQHCSPIIINDAYNDPRFYGEVDKRSGFHTRNILCIPLINRQKVRIGALQNLNRLEGEFTQEDLDLLTSLSHYVAVALENARLYEELKALDRAKERVINHLSHELRTPLAIISSALERISRDLKDGRLDRIGRNTERSLRSVDRLRDLELKIEDIVAQRPVIEEGTVIRIIEDALNLVEELQSQSESTLKREILESVSERLRSLYTQPQLHMERILLEDFLRAVCEETLSALAGRRLTIRKRFAPGITITMDRQVLKKVCTALLKNAVENTPDEGEIEFCSEAATDATRIEVKDYGIGITPQNQEMILGGFFHTQDTMLYASKKPYQFTAGGSGADLLRAKIFSERLNFSIQFHSVRCRFLPLDTDLCPGVISECRHIQDPSECLRSGGTTFTLRFPLESFR